MANGICCMKSKLIAILLTLSTVSHAQTWNWWPTGISNASSADTLRYETGLTGVVSSGNYAPFWIQSNRNGTISASPYSGNLSAGILKEANSPTRWWDYDFAIQITGRVQSNMPISPMPAMRVTGLFNLLYAHARLYIFDITAGIRPMQYEVQDSLLSSGSMVFSGNSQPLPRITIGIDRYTPFPGCYGYFEIKGGLTHAWMADNVFVNHAYIHHKFLGFRIGDRLPVNISYEFHHAAEWGGYSPIVGNIGNGIRSWWNVMLAHGGGTTRNDQLNAEGNHVGSQQLALTGKGNGWEVTAYWQNFLEDNFVFIGFGQNIADGLWGISMKQTRWSWIEGVTYEYLNTTDQSGPWHDRDGLCYAGKDTYYQNSIFQNGWNYFYRSMGTPFITSPLYNQDGSIATQNSRVKVHHVGVRGNIYGFKYRLLASHARNYGNDCSSRALVSKNTALLMEISKTVPRAWGLEFSASLAADIGNQFGNTFGAMVAIRKKGIITSW